MVLFFEKLKILLLGILVLISYLIMILLVPDFICKDHLSKEFQWAELVLICLELNIVGQKKPEAWETPPLSFL